MSALLDGRSETGKLVSAFVDTVEGAVRRLGGGARWSAVEEPDGIALWRVRRGRAERRGDVATDERARRRLGARPVELRLDPGKLVEATFKLPGEARGFADQVIGHRLDKLTPWRADKVLYGYEVSPEKDGEGQHEVRVLATSRDIAEAALARLRALGIQATALGSAAEPVERPLAIDLFAREAARPRLRRRRLIAGAAVAGLALSLALFAYTQWLVSAQAAERGLLEARIAETRQKLAAGAGTDGTRARDLALIQARTPQRAAFVLIDHLARALPDDTVLDELELKPENVRIAGSAADAPALVAPLEADPLLEDSRFVAPVSRQLDGRDRFEIVLSRTGAPKREGS